MSQEPSSQVTNYTYVSTQDGLVARGNNAATAFSLGTVNNGASMNRFATVAAGTGCSLPPATQGMQITVINSGANPLTVYGAGGDTINGVAAGTGVPMMINSVATFNCLTTGAWFTMDLGTGFASNAQGAAVATFSSQTGITASTTHTAVGGTPITASQAQISTCANLGDAVTLPPALAGMEICIANNGAQQAGVYPSGTDQINAGGAGTPANQNANTVTIYYCFATGFWVTK
jgi:hypothetical protein